MNGIIDEQNHNWFKIPKAEMNEGLPNFRNYIHQTTPAKRDGNSAKHGGMYTKRGGTVQYMWRSFHDLVHQVVKSEPPFENENISTRWFDFIVSNWKISDFYFGHVSVPKQTGNCLVSGIKYKLTYLQWCHK